MRKFVAAWLLLAFIVAAPSWSALTEARYSWISGLGEHILLYEDTSAANTQLDVTTTAKAYARRLRSITVECSASASITVTAEIDRAQIGAGTLDVSLPNITITSATSGAQYLDLVLAPDDTVSVTVPAAGAGVTCTAQVLEQAQ